MRLTGAVLAAAGADTPLEVGRVRGAERARANMTALAHLERRLRGLQVGWDVGAVDGDGQEQYQLLQGARVHTKMVCMW